MTDATDADGAEVEATARPQTSTRDRDELHGRLVTWLAGRVADPEVSELVVPESNGMSSETLLFECTWGDPGGAPGRRVTQACAARLVPDPAAVPVFPVYDLERQFRVLRLVGERTRVPVPRTLWLELDPEAIGSPFFVMERVDGVVPPDIMPYPFGSWLSEARRADQDRLQDGRCASWPSCTAPTSAPRTSPSSSSTGPETPLCGGIWPNSAPTTSGSSPTGRRSPLIERTFAWLEDHWPASEGPPVISWGDARIGNMMFRDFEPVAVLDWEMAAVGPREIDIGWMVYLHRFLDDIALQAGLPGMPHFMRLDDVAAAYARHSGHEPRHLDFFTMYAALRHAIVMSRVARRQVLFGEIDMPDDPDDMIMHRPTLEEMLAGTYWEKL